MTGKHVRHTPEDILLNLKRALYHALDLWRGTWCNGCRMHYPLPHTCAGKHLYPLYRDGQDVVEFGRRYHSPLRVEDR